MLRETEFNTVGTAWVSAVVRCLNYGQPRVDSVELIGESMMIRDPTACVIYNRVRRCQLGYLGAELAWYLSGSNTLENLKLFAPSYTRFSDDGVTAYGAYGFRGLGLFELEALAQRIKERPMSRQHVIPIWRPDDIGSSSLDVPCTVALQFLVDGSRRLNLVVSMRSNDLFKGFLYDVPVFCLILQLVASLTEFHVGYYYHNVGSLHIYERDEQRLIAAMAAETASLRWSDFDLVQARKLISAFNGETVKETDSSAFNTVLEAMATARSKR
jgi:thymidylate synthase